MQTPEMIPDNQSNDVPDNAASFIYVNNAGIALAVPYFTRLFNMLKLTENNKFTGIDTQIRAACLIRYITHPGKGFPEAEMQLNKLLTNLPANQPIPSVFQPTQEETEAIQSLLSALLQNWPKLKRTSIEAFRDAFLLRDGRFEEMEKERYDILTVEEKPYDLLLDSCPWNFRILRLPWMPKILQIKWR